MDTLQTFNMKRLLLILIININVFAVSIDSFINKDNCDQIINKQVFDICYSYKNKGALFVSYELDGKLVNKNNIKKRPSFYNEKNLPLKYRSKSKDYTRTGYDRGHLANDASFDYDKKTQRKTYTMANIIPQAPNVNRRTWIKAERYERSIAVKLGKVNVLNGVIYSENPKRIGKNQIAVPVAFWKMIFNNEKKFQKCFYYKNDNNINIKEDKLKKHQRECNKLY